jgi:adenylate kinase family enzyme
MKEVLLVKSENKQKVEDILKKDDIVSRGSITIKTSQSLDIKEDGYFFILDAQPEVIKRAEELTKGLAEKYKHAKKVIEKVEEQENSAIEGFGNILG